MTARQVFESTLIELSKIQAPSLKLYEFNYLFNKAINQYINKVYNVYDLNQQTTDDLRVLKATAFLTPHKVELKGRNIENGYDSAIQNTNAITGNRDQNIGSDENKVGYNGLLIALNEERNPLAYIQVIGSEYFLFNTNDGEQYNDGFESINELLKHNSEIQYLELIKFV